MPIGRRATPLDLGAVGCCRVGGGVFGLVGRRGRRRGAADDILRIALIAPESFDPAAQRITSPSAMIAMDLLADGLTTIDPETGEIEPELAESWQVSESGLQWRFDLRTDTEAGQPVVTSADVKWTLTRIAERGQQSIPGSALAPVVGYEEAATGSGVEFKGVDAPQADRVVIQLAEPFAALPALLAHPSFGILPEGKDAISLDPDARLSSAFRVVDSTPDRLVIDPVTRFDGSLARIEIAWTSDDAAGLAAVMDGDADLAPVDAKQVGISENELIEPFGATVFYGLNKGHPKLRDPDFRRAIVQSVDRSDLAADLFGDAAAPLAGLIPEPGRDVCGDDCAYDPDAAVQLLAAAFGDDEVPALALDYPADDEAERTLAEAVAGSLADVGIRTRLRSGSVDDLEERIADGRHQLFRFGWVAAYDDPQAWLDSPFRSNGADNVFTLADSDVDRLIKQLARTDNLDDRADVAEELERTILTEYVVVPVLARQQVMARDERVDGLQLRVDGTFPVDQLVLVGPE